MADQTAKRKPSRSGKVKTSIQIEAATLKRMKRAAKQERRTVSGLVENLVEERYAATANGEAVK